MEDEDNREIREDVGLREILLLRRMPCGSFEANAVFFRIGVLAYTHRPIVPIAYDG